MPEKDTMEIKVTAECVVAGRAATCEISALVPGPCGTKEILGTAPEILEAILSAGVETDGLIITGISSRSPAPTPYRIVIATGEGRVVLATTISRGEPEALLEAFWRTASAQANPVSEPVAFCEKLSRMTLVSIQPEPAFQAQDRKGVDELTGSVAALADVLKRVEARMGVLSDAAISIRDGKAVRPRAGTPDPHSRGAAE